MSDSWKFQKAVIYEKPTKGQGDLKSRRVMASLVPKLRHLNSKYHKITSKL